MAVDPYALCICGSGKKVKFCCHAVIPEMEKIARLRENKQFSMAKQKLDQLDQQFPGNGLVNVTRAELSISERQYEEAVRQIAPFVKENPDHKYGLVLHAMARLSSSGFMAARRTVHRAFQKCHRSHPEAVSQIAAGIATMMYSNESFMAARQHLAVALRFADEEQRQRLFFQMASLEGNDEIAYPLRSIHQLLPYSGTKEAETEASRAQKLSSLGCWEPAAILFGRLTESDPDSAILWYNLGLCQAWDGDEPTAAESLHKAAALFPETSDEYAIEAETLAQLLDLETTDAVTPFISQRFEVEQISRLLTTLDGHERFFRVPQEKDSNRPISPVATYSIVDRVVAADVDGSDWTFNDVPTSLADVAIYDNDENAQVTGAYLTGISGDELTTAESLFVEVAGDQVRKSDNDKPTEVGVVPNEMLPLQWAWHFPKSVPDIVRRELERQKWDEVVSQTWPQNGITALDGKSPRETADAQDASDAAATVKLRSAVNVLDVYCVRQGYSLDRGKVYKELGLQPLSPIEITGATPVVGLSTLQLREVEIEKLTDDQLNEIVNRALLVRHPVFLERVLNEVNRREPCLEKVGSVRVYAGLHRICREQGRRDEALNWIKAARDAESPGRSAFEHRMEWDLRELNFRMEDPSDDELPKLVKRIQAEYGSKVPELNQVLGETLAEVGLQNLIGEPAIVTASSPILPGEAQEEAGGEKKLWLPGQ